MEGRLNTHQLKEKLKANPTTGLIKGLSAVIRDQHFNLDDLIDMTFHADKKIAFKAAWLLDTTLEAQPELYTDKLQYLISRVKDVTNESCKRHYARIVMLLTDEKSPIVIQHALHTIDMDEVVEQLFDWLIDPKIKIAIKVCAADALYNLSSRYDWIADELANQIRHIMQSSGFFMNLRGKKLLAQLEK